MAKAKAFRSNKFWNNQFQATIQLRPVKFQLQRRLCIINIAITNCMSKKRGVVVSMAENPQAITKSKSAQTNPLNPDIYNHSLNKFGPNDATRSVGLQVMGKVQLSESNLLSSQPEFMINQAHYTYQDPDYGVNYDANKQEQNDQYFIESMHKKKQMQQKNRKKQEKQKLAQRFAKSTGAYSKEKRLLKNKEAQKHRTNKLAKYGSSPKNVKTKNNNEKQHHHKCEKTFKYEGQTKNVQHYVKKQLNSERFKPRPLHFDVDILQKLPMQAPHKRKIDTLTDFKTSFKSINKQYTQTIDNHQSEEQSKNGQNRNCRKLPFRFQGVV